MPTPAIFAPAGVKARQADEDDAPRGREPNATEGEEEFVERGGAGAGGAEEEEGDFGGGGELFHHSER